MSSHPAPWRSLCLLCVLTLCSGTAAIAQNEPLPPDAISAVPTYTPERPITVRWIILEDLEDRYIVERSTDQTTWEEVCVVEVGNPTEFVDTSPKDLDLTYYYRVKAHSDEYGSSPWVTCSTRLRVTWPMANGSHQMLQGFADATPNNEFQFHEGIDIMPNGTDRRVIAARGGNVVRVDGWNTGGTIVVEVDLGGGNSEYDTYLHLVDHEVEEGNHIGEGELLGQVLTPYPGGPQGDHLHFSVTATPLTRDDNTSEELPKFEDQWLNPLLRFHWDADRDPQLATPGLEDTNDDDITLFVVESGKSTPPDNFADFTEQTIHGDVDIVADIRDQMETTRGDNGFLGASSPHEMGYYVRALFNQVPFHDVRDAASPYILARFDDNWFAGEPFGNGLFSAVYADNRVEGHKEQDLRIDPNDTIFPMTQHFVVTNTNGSTGLPANVDAGQFWNTNAIDMPGIDDDSDGANCAAVADAEFNADARFKDGDYEIHILSKDLVHDTNDQAAGKVRLDNFAQTAGTASGGRQPATGETPPLYLPNSTPWVPEFDLPPERAGISAVYSAGETIGILGEQYYPELVMPAYVLQHQADGWSEEESLLAGVVASTLVLSDDIGGVPLTVAWDNAQPGRYDVVIDYDRDDTFSATLDGLDGFVVLEPEEETPPIAVVRVDAMFDANHSFIMLDASQSIDPEEDSTTIAEYSWFNAAGNPLGFLTGPTPSLGLYYSGLAHTTDTAALKLTVVDEEGDSDSETLQIRYNNAPPEIVVSSADRIDEMIEFYCMIDDPDESLVGVPPSFEVLAWEFDVCSSTDPDCIGDGFLSGEGPDAWGSYPAADLLALLGPTTAAAWGVEPSDGEDWLQTVYFNASDLAGAAVTIPLEVDLTPIPEPATLVLLAIAGLCMLLRRRRPNDVPSIT